MNAEAIESFLVTLYLDGDARERFLADPGAEARRAGFDEPAAQMLAAIDRQGLRLAAASFAHKRAKNPPRPRRSRIHRLLSRILP